MLRRPLNVGFSGGAGKLFDAHCVEVLADVLARERRSDLAVAV